MHYYQIDWLEISKTIHQKSRERFTLADLPAEIQFIFKNISQLRKESLDADETYGRHVLFSTPDFEVMMASWRPHATCAPHDHGFSTGTVLVLEGSFEEMSYKWSADSGEVAVDPSTARRASLGQFIEVEGNTFHHMRNLGDVGVTLHFYTPAISNMKVLDLDNKKTLIVSEDCGAWIPKDPKKIREIQPWQRTQIG